MKKTEPKEKIKEQTAIKFKVYNPNFASFSLFPLEQSGLTEEKFNNVKGLTFEISTINQIYLDVDLIVLITTFHIFGDQGKTHLLAEIVTHHQFFIEDLKTHISSNEGEPLRFNKPFLATLMGIALSTSRGMIKVKLEGSYIVNPVLPIIDPMTLVK